MKIGIIGGKGAMGKWFVGFFKEKGYEVVVSDIGTKLTNEELAGTCDVVIVSVPISKTVKVIESVRNFVGGDSLLMDFTSLKSEPVKAMLKGTRCSVVGCHPMFAPTLDNMKGQTVVLCKGRGDKWFKWANEIFAGAKIKITEPEKHDKYMAAIQGALHFSSIAFCHALKEMNIDIKESLDFASPVYLIRLYSLVRIFNQDPALYADIELCNPEVKDAISGFLKSADKLKSFIDSGNKEKFINFMNEAGDYLGKDFKKEAQKKSDELIKKMNNS